MLPEQVVQWFLAARRRGDAASGARRPCRSATLDSYTKDLERFTAFLELAQVNDFCQVSRHTIRDYVTWVQERDWSDAYKFKLLRSLRSFLRFIELDEDCQDAGLRPLRKALPSIPQSKIKTDAIPSWKQVKAMLDAALTHRRNGHRDYVVMSLLLETGMRIGEISLLTLGHLKLDENFIIVPNEGKTGSRLVPISADMARILKTWLKRRATFATCDRAFVSEQGGPASVDMFEHSFRRLCAVAKVPTINPHAFRHFFATKYLERGGDIAKLQRILGHSSFDVLKIYLHLSVESITAEHAKVNPRAALVGKEFSKSGLTKVLVTI